MASDVARLKALIIAEFNFFEFLDKYYGLALGMKKLVSATQHNCNYVVILFAP
jgi:hypothetical protein